MEHPAHGLPIQVEQYLKGMPGDDASEKVVTLTVTAENDYHTLEPWRLTDPNENVSEVLFDPLKEKLQGVLSVEFYERLRIEHAQLGNDAGIIGSAALALEGT